MLKNAIKIAAIGAVAWGATTVGASAGLTKQPGETSGLARGAPLPEGVYFVNTISWGERSVPGRDTGVLVDVPVIAWSTPWTVLGANVQVLGALPNIYIDPPGNNNSDYGLYNPFLAGALAWDLGNGIGVSYTSGFYFNVGEKDIRVRATTWRQDFAASYTADGWNLTANVTWSITFDTDRIAGGKTSNGLGIDLTATKTFGNWEVGAVGFGSTEYDLPTGQAGKGKQFALGPLVGYNFGPAILQAYVTRDIYQRNLGGKETRFWGRVIIPLWTPTAAAAPLVTKY
ncbi:transporter [Hansschlegelia quercus]|uniref:Transporter n=1 Tax=Hansschlegelia quercus TaxID=2528245 RepID=A0A4Q9GKY5_9HYPH|nr:transporter [Hansschlegelia quercus]TBN54882.1 transporter [Hansschlegelia quercus]